MISQAQLQKTEQHPSLPYCVVDTGQTKCYDNRGEIAPPKPGQPFYGQDAQYRGLQPAYKDNGDGTVTDLGTGLMWIQDRSQSVSPALAVTAGVIVAPKAASQVVGPPERGPGPVAASPLDLPVRTAWRGAGIQPAPLCGDEVFIRRVYLDVIGTLPAAAEVRTFLEDKNPNKRTLLIDRLLERDEFADYWAMKWSNLLRVKSEFPINLWPNAVQAYHRWIRTSIKENMPYDRFVREMLTASGSNIRKPQVNFYRAVQSKDPQALA